MCRLKSLAAAIAVSLIAGPALAAGAPPPPSWTGFYVGVIGGYATGPAHADPAGILPLIGAYPVNFNIGGGFAGGQIGYNYQFANRSVALATWPGRI